MTTESEHSPSAFQPVENSNQHNNNLKEGSFGIVKNPCKSRILQGKHYKIVDDTGCLNDAAFRSDISLILLVLLVSLFCIYWFGIRRRRKEKYNDRKGSLMTDAFENES